MQCVSTVYIINDDNEFLMMYNKKQGAWLPPGGFLEENELMYECAIRETIEEVGKKIGENLCFLGNVPFSNNVLDERTVMIPVPIFIAKQTLTNGKMVENFCYLAATKEKETNNDYNATWFSFDKIAELDTFDNVKLQLKYIYENKSRFNTFPINQSYNNIKCKE